MAFFALLVILVYNINRTQSTVFIRTPARARAPPPDPALAYFVTKWNIPAGFELFLPFEAGGDDYYVDWGDGGGFVGPLNGRQSHTYTAENTETIIKIKGTTNGIGPNLHFRMNNNVAPYDTDDSKDKLLAVERWGNVMWTSMEDSFFGCSNMDVTATDKPDLSLVTNAFRMFSLCNSLINANGSISGWDVSNLENMNSVFMDVSMFNQPLNDWDVSNVTNMPSLFANASSFNQPLDGWDVSNVASMSNMFNGASAFNRPIEAWDVSNVTQMLSMFNGASAFDQSLGDWKLNSLASAFFIFNNVGISPANYDTTLIGWAANTAIAVNVSLFSFPSLQYTVAAAPAVNDLMTMKGWSNIGTQIP